jgi:hypothetical protein
VSLPCTAECPPSAEVVAENAPLAAFEIDVVVVSVLAAPSASGGSPSGAALAGAALAGAAPPARPAATPAPAVIAPRITARRPCPPGRRTAALPFRGPGPGSWLSCSLTTFRPFRPARDASRDPAFRAAAGHHSAPDAKKPTAARCPGAPGACRVRQARVSDDPSRSVMRCRWGVLYPGATPADFGRRLFNGNPWAHVEIDLETGSFAELENPLPTPDSLYAMCDPEWMAGHLRDGLAMQLAVYAGDPDYGQPGCSSYSIPSHCPTRPRARAQPTSAQTGRARDRHPARRGGCRAGGFFRAC